MMARGWGYKKAVSPKGQKGTIRGEGAVLDLNFDDASMTPCLCESF